MRGRTIALLVAAMLLGASSARASEASKIIDRCTHGQPLGGFSENGYRQALKQLATGTSEYSDCPERIRRAELAASGGGAGAGASEAGGAISNVALPLTPVERARVLEARHRGATPVLVGKAPVSPGVVHADIASTASRLPTSLLAALGLMLGAVALLATTGIFRRLRAHRHR